MDFLTSTVAAVVTTIAEPLFTPFRRSFGYLIHYDSNIKDLQEQVNRLRDKEADLKLDTEAAERRGEVVAPAVESWLKKVDGINIELGQFLEQDVKESSTYLNGMFPNLKSRYSSSRKAKKKTQEVLKLQEDGKFVKTSYPAPPKLHSRFTDSFVGFTSRILIVNKVLEALKDDEMSMIGICGMGGVGKTTLVKEVIKRVERENMFDEIVLTVVSQTPDPAKVQDQIGDRIGLKLEEGCVGVRASRLHHRLKEIQRILIILDDLWAELDLEEIGIPCRDDHHGCKIVLASRMEDVCNKMKSQVNFRVSVLSEGEAWDLFREMAGQSVDQAHILPIAKDVAQECRGLPIAIVTVAKTLRDKDKYIWEDALKQLKKPTITSFSEMHEGVFSKIELSYRYLKNEESRLCFLLCSLFPENFNIPVEYLVRYGVGLQLFKGTDSMRDARNRVQTIIDRLKSSFLLLDGDKQEHVKMHDVVRDVALSIASKEDQKFLVRCDSQVKEWPNEEAYEHYSASSVVFEKIKDSASSLECSRLQLLQLSCCSGSQNVPYSLLEGRKALKVLALKGMSIVSQPPPLQVLRDLRTLHLEDCEIKDVHILGEVENLEILSLVGSKISEVPIEMRKLRCLKLLDATECSFAKGISPGVLSELSHLQEFYMRKSFYRWESVKEEHEHNGRLIHLEKKRRNASVEELKGLSHLRALDIHIPDARCLPKDMPFYNLTTFKISIRSGISNEGLYLFQNTLTIEADAIDIMESGIHKLFKKTEVLSLNLKQLKNILSELDGEGFPCLKSLTLESCFDMEYFTDTRDFLLHNTFPLLESLSICKLVNLREIWHNHLPARSSKEIEMITPCVQPPTSSRRESTQVSCFGNLKFLKISGCSKLKIMFPLSVARSLVQLQDLYIGSCMEMEGIFLEEEEEDVFAFPKLTNLTLFILPKLIGFSKGVDDIEAKLPSLKPQGDLSANLDLRGNEMKNIKEIQGESSVPVSCKLFTSQWISRLLNLQKLEVHCCKLLEWVFNLESAYVEGDKKTSPTLQQLEEIKLYFLPELTHVWKNFPKGFQGFKRLKVLSVERCHSLKYLFSPSIAKLFVELERINIEDCAMMESIVAKEAEVDEATGVIMFCKLNSLHLCNLPKLVSFCPDSNILELPSLNKLLFTECPKLKIFCSTIHFPINPMLNHIKPRARGSPIIQDADLNDSNLSQVHFSNEFLCRCFGCSRLHPMNKSKQSYPKKEGPSHNLVCSNATDGKETQSCAMFNVIDEHQHLQTLELSFCESVEVVFNIEKSHASPVLNNLQTLTLSSLPKLTYIWKMSAEKITGFQNLKQLEIHECNSLRSLIPSVIAGFFVKLELVKITSCELMEEIIAPGKLERTEIMMFPQLNSIILSDLPNLIKFCSEVCATEFPMLMTMKMVGCPKLETFGSANVLSPRLNIILAESSSYPLRGDLNDTIKQIFKGKTLLEPIQDELQLGFPNAEVESDISHLASSSSDNVTKGGNGLEGYESVVTKEVEGGRNLDDQDGQCKEAELKNDDTYQGHGTSWGKEEKNAVVEDGGREIKSSNIGKNKEDDFEVDYSSDDDSTEGNIKSFLIPTNIVVERENTLVASTSQVEEARTTNLTQFRIGAYADFFGFEVESHYVSYLQRFYNVEGKFWENCIFKTSCGISLLLNMLGGALQTLDKVLTSVTYKELKMISESIEDVSKAGFRVDSLMPLVTMIIASYEKRSRYECLESEMNALEVRLTTE